MEQLNIHIQENNGKDWGIKKIVSINWSHGRIYNISIDWYDNEIDSIPMWDYNGTGEFVNSHGNLIGKIIK